MSGITPSDVHHFWFGELPGDLDALLAMFKRLNPSIDAEVRQRFGATIASARQGELDHWAETPQGRLALVLVLDQFPRHAFRGSVEQYASDAKALELALSALDTGWDAGMAFVERMFLCMPLAHSEDVEIHRRNVGVADRMSAEAPDWVDFFAEVGPSQSRKYLGVIERFGRFPHRNELYGRESTPEELEFLKTWAEIQPPDPLRERGLIPPPK